MKWIPVTESLPDSDKTVMTYEPDSCEPIWPAYHNGDEWQDITNGSLLGVTHWMEFPEPPGE